MIHGFAGRGRIAGAIAVAAFAWAGPTQAAPPDTSTTAPPDTSTTAPRMDDSTAAPRMDPPPPRSEIDAALSLDPGATCLDRATLLADLRSWQREADPGAPFDPRVAIVVVGDAQDPQRLRFEVRFAEAIVVERSFDPAPDDCTDLHAVVALAIAIALDDTLAGELGIVVPPPADAPQVGPGDGDLPAGDEPPPRRPARPGPALGLTAAAGLFAGFSPRMSAGGLLSFDVRPLDHLDIRVGALATHHQGFDFDAGAVAVTVAAGRIDLCWGTAPLDVRLRLCAGFAGGATVARGRGFDRDFTQATPWLAALAGADLITHLVGPLALELRVEGVFPLQRTRVDIRSVEGQRLASQSFPPVGLLVAVGPRLQF